MGSGGGRELKVKDFGIVLASYFGLPELRSVPV